MAAGSKFLLLQLPHREVLRTIQVMDIYQKMSFSLISKRCKKLVQSLQIKVQAMSVNISAHIRISVLFSEWTLKIYFKHTHKEQMMRIRAPQLVEADDIRLERVDFEYSDWLKHFQDIFHCPPIENIGFLWRSSEYDLDYIKEVVGAIKRLHASDTGCNEYNLMLLQKFFPIENLNINTDMFKDSKIPLYILQQNYTTLDINCDDDETEEMTLDELLVINSKSITIKNVRVSPQDLNKYIKLWIKGSNSRMEYFLVLTLIQYDRAVVMKGVKHSKERSDEWDVSRVSMDICRTTDGTRAIVSFSDSWIEVDVCL
ncbi:unnamed protein product [Caenorhabditis brenneri]